jgi:hypothetical protein
MAETADPRSVARHALLAAMRDAGEARWVPLAGESMTPIIPAGASALVDFGARDPAVGHVVLANAGGRFVVHRVVAAPTARRPKRYLLKGDAEPFADARIGRDAIFGTVRAVRVPDGPLSRAGLRGRRAHLIAVTSRLASRTLRAALPLAAVLPPAGRRRVGRALASVVRAPVLMLAITPRVGEPIAIHGKGGES